MFEIDILLKIEREQPKFGQLGSRLLVHDDWTNLPEIIRTAKRTTGQENQGLVGLANSSGKYC